MRGFTAVEAIVSVALLALFAVVISNMLLKMTQTRGMLGDRQRTTALANMVFEDYSRYAAGSFEQMAGFDVSEASPKEFFHSRDNLGFDDMRLTTQARFNPSHTECTVIVTVRRPGKDGAPRTFSRLFHETAMGSITDSQDSGV